MQQTTCAVGQVGAGRFIFEHIALVFTVANFMLLTLIYEIGNLKNHEAWPVEIHVQGSYLFLD